MKNNIKVILFCGLFSLLGGLTSCTAYLDKAPASTVDPENQYKNFTNFQGFTEQLYNCIPSFCNRDDNNFFNNGEEEHWAPNAANQVAWIYSVDMGNFWAWQKEFGYGSGGSFLDSSNGFDQGSGKSTKALWPGCWFGIRKANEGLANLSKMSGTTDEKNYIAGQLYFFRAWFHFSLISYWGGMPYISKVLPADKPLTLKRLTYQACADSIAKDFQRAYELLPGKWAETNPTDPGFLTATKNDLRINKWMALAYLGKNYLWAGSPLMNMASGGTESYNQAYCKKAADAFGTLLKASEDGTCQYSLIPWSNYSDLVHTNGQGGKMPGSATVNGVVYNEAIFRGPNYGGTGQSMDKEYLCGGGVLQDRSWSQYPTANYVNYFGMNNGMPITKVDADEPAIGYDTHYPWKNRDPRFYINFAYDTKRMINTGSNGKNYTYANLYNGGNYTLNGGVSAGCTTGYLLLKFNPVGLNKYDNAYNNHQVHMSWLRLGDAYLMYSEAVAQGYQSLTATSNTFSQNAVYAINKIRNRVVVNAATDARLPGINAKFLTNLDDFMSELRRERAVELAYEGHRFNDLRRWHLLAKYPYNIKTGITFDRDIKETNNATPTFNFLDKTVPENNKINNLKEVVLLTRYYSEKHYWLPLKRADANIYADFPQNPGW